jgi:hypothetical protein
VADTEQVEGVPLQRRGCGGKPEAGQGGAGGLDLVEADCGQISEQAVEAVHGKIALGALRRRFGQGDWSITDRLRTELCLDAPWSQPRLPQLPSPAGSYSIPITAPSPRLPSLVVATRRGCPRDPHHLDIPAATRPYGKLGDDYFSRRLDPGRETRRLIAKLEALGHQVTPPVRRLTRRTPGSAKAPRGAACPAKAIHVSGRYVHATREAQTGSA